MGFRSGITNHWLKRLGTIFSHTLCDVQQQLQRTGDLNVKQAMDNEELINMVSDGIIQRVHHTWETQEPNTNDENKPPLMEAPKPTEELLLALTQKMDAFRQALATIQQKVPVAQPPQNTYCTFIPQHPPNFGYAPYPTPP